MRLITATVSRAVKLWIELSDLEGKGHNAHRHVNMSAAMLSKPIMISARS